MWRLWTKGWGPRAWWFWLWREGVPIWCAWRVPRWLAYWVVIRVYAATGQNPQDMTFDSALKAWSAGAGTSRKRRGADLNLV